MTGFWMSCLDLRGCGDELAHVLTAATKKQAMAVARERGWAQQNICQAATRFNRFWVLMQWVEYGKTCRCAARTPGATVLVTLHDGGLG